MDVDEPIPSVGSLANLPRDCSQLSVHISNIFCSVGNKDTRWRMKVNQWSQSSIHYSIALYLESTQYDFPVRARSTFYMLAGQQQIYVDAMGPVTFDMGGNRQHNWPSTCSNKIRSHLNNYCTVTIQCEVVEFPDIPNFIVKNIVVKECDIVEHCNVLFTTKEWSDVKIAAKGEIEFEAHKLILAARSSVFAAMFKNAMAEQNTNSIEITDIEPKIVEEMLRFIYTGSVNDIDEIAIELVAAADKYDLERLKQMCEAQLKKDLNIENAAFTLTIADRHNCEQLKKHTKIFIAKFARKVMGTEGYSSMIKSHIHLAEEILHTLVLNK